MGHSHAKTAYTSESHSQIWKQPEVMKHILTFIFQNLKAP